mmetsp:Transcript_41491/g.91159  ORF Transcript_41491/g.91159 Transcript_41491/m.91159 type:complete len:303 (-) Transcript_41491:399-1307(-)
MRHWAAVLQKLSGAHDAHVLDALDGLGGHVGREVLVAEDGEPLLERQLEPVAARDAVAAPVVEVLVRNHALHALVVGVSGGRGLGEHARRVEHVEALVLHGAHVEVVDGDNVVDVEVVLAAVGLLVPLHRVLEALHGPVELVDVLMLRPDGQAHLVATHRDKTVLDPGEVARHQGEEVAGLAEGVLKLSPVAAALGLALGDLVAVGEKHRVFGLVRLDAHSVLRHDVGAVGEVGDAAEALRLALCAEVAARGVETGELRVELRLDRDDRREREGRVWRLQHRQELGVNSVVGALNERGAVQL